MIRSEDRDGIRTLWLERPAKRNALTTAMIEELGARLRESAAAGARAVLIAGAGPSTSAGVDLEEFARGDPASARKLIGALAATCAAARECPLPVAMAIQGHCLGGALELACACDLRVAARGALLGMPEVWLGIPSVIDAALIERLTGLGRAHELLLTGDLIDAQRALDWGLVNRVVEPDRLLEETAALLGRVTRHDRDAVARQKELFRDWLNLPLDEAIARSHEQLAASFAAGTPQRLAREWLGAR